MGQRLVIRIMDDGKELANAYYHWSAYTGSALHLTKDILDYYASDDEHLSKLQTAVKLLYLTGARFYPNEIEWMEEERIGQEDFAFAFDDVEADRNNGLLSVSQKGMSESVSCAEGIVEIDISTGDIEFDVYYEEDVNDYTNEYEVTDNINNIPVLNLDYELNMDTFDKFYNSIMEILNSGNYCAIKPNKGCIYSFIA